MWNMILPAIYNFCVGEYSAFASWHLASVSQKLASNIYSAHDINLYSQYSHRQSFFVYWLLTENYVLYANILVFMLINTELFSNVSGLGLIHCDLGLKKIFGPRPRPHSFWRFWPRPRPYAQLASLTSLCITDLYWYHVFLPHKVMLAGYMLWSCRPWVCKMLKIQTTNMKS